MNRVVATRVRFGLLAVLLALAALPGAGSGVAPSAPGSANSLVGAVPAPNGLLAIPPDQIALTFNEPLDREHASVHLLHAGGAEVPLASVQVDPADAMRLIARPQSILGLEDFTVVWSARAAASGELLAGAYPFRTGVVANPGAAQLDGEWPEPWATLLRWLVFLGTALAAGGFAWARLLALRAGGRAPASPLHVGAMTIGALAALLAAVLPPALGSLMFAAPDAPPLTAALRAMPLGWWLQMAALVVLALLCLGVLASGRSASRLPAALARVGIGAGLTALFGFSLT
ncbi:MAG: copper resistance CopC family protein, partial [Thermomicrobiales bacterium]